MTRLPPTSEEIKAAIQLKNGTHDLVSLRLVGRRSFSASIALHFCGVLAKSARRRALQVTLCAVLCYSRFKLFEEGIALPTTCKNCRMKDRADNLLLCTELTPPELSGDSESAISFLAESARRFSCTP